MSCLIADKGGSWMLCSGGVPRWLSSRSLVSSSLCVALGLACWFPPLDVAPLVGGRELAELPST
jgi:hypothetical protein